MENQKNYKEFGLSSWAIDNRTTIFIFTIVITLMGLNSFNTLPKESFPEIAIPTIYVSTFYPGTSPPDIENLITRKIEKEIKSIKDIREITSSSKQDYSSIIVEFETNVDIKEAKRNVQEAVDRANSELPADLPAEPAVQDINLSEIPIMFVNISGNFDNETLKKYAEMAQEEIETLGEITRVDIVGALDKEVQVNVDLYKMESTSVSFGDVESSIANENIIISGGEIDYRNQAISLRLNSEFESLEEIRNLVVRSGRGNSAYLRDIATIELGYKERESYSRLDGKPVLTLNVIKKSGENLVAAAHKIREIIKKLENSRFPEGLTVTVSSDQAIQIENTLQELTNTIIIGFILVTLVLMFFMGVRDALFVGLAIPLASFIAFIILPFIGFTLNMVVLFSFIMALGIVVDNAIVVIENTYRILNEEKLPIVDAAKKAAGEVIGPVFSGTLTTMAPFLPLVFWPGTTGEFMFFLPITLLITLGASLIVAYVINPVFAVSFMTPDDPDEKTNYIRLGIYSAVIALIAILFHLGGSTLVGNLLLFVAVFIWINALVLKPVIRIFQTVVIPAVKNVYRGILAWSLRGWNPLWVVLATIVLFIMSVALFSVRSPQVIYFPEAEPNFVYVYNTMPIGTNIETTDSITHELERRVNKVIGQNNPIVKSVVTNVAVGAGDPMEFDPTANPNKSKVSVEFVEFKKRGGISTTSYLSQIREAVKGIPGTEVIVDRESGGPPTDAPVNIEVVAEDFNELIKVSQGLRSYLDSINIPGVEELKSNLQLGKPELLVNVNREKASQLGMSSGQIGSAIRTALYGKEASKFRDNEDDYPIQVRLDKKYRENLSALLDMRVSFMDMASGRFKSVPISAVADVKFSSTYGGINRTDLEKSVTITSNVLEEYNVMEVNADVSYWLDMFKKSRNLPSTIEVKQGGETQDQAETAEFLGGAFLASVLFIVIILVTQFNSVTNVFIILSQVFFSLIGVLLGYAVTGMDLSVLMAGVGIVALAGIVVNNGIILLDYFDILQRRGYGFKESIIEGGAVRFTPVLLTAFSTVLGLVPLAIAMNLNFETLFTRLDPQLFFGGDSAAFWGPLSLTIIFGLIFATIVTLIIVPVMYYLLGTFKEWLKEKLKGL